MFRLTRQVRLAIDNPQPCTAGPHDNPVRNGHAGFPALTSLSPFLAIDVTLAGQIDTESGYLINIKQIDELVRRDGLPLLREFAQKNPAALGAMATEVFQSLQKSWPNLERLAIALSPFTCLSIQATEHPMVRFSHKFEFSAAHRLHNPKLSDAENAALFGKCNNPLGHGHNYELEVTIKGPPDSSGRLFPITQLEEVVLRGVIDRFDHKFLNLETDEFKEVNPTVENIAKAIYHLLNPMLKTAGTTLAAVTVWETPKTWCEYSE